jgi:cobalt-zinc-cadmium efflux system outer membrane protein
MLHPASLLPGRALLCALSLAAPLRGLAVDLDGALHMAAHTSPALAAARLDIDAYDGAVRQARAAPNPTLSYETQRGRIDQRETTWLLTQPLEAPAKRAGRTDVALADQQIAAATHAVHAADLHAQVVAAFHAVLLARERARLLDDGVTLAARANAAVARKVVAGKLSPVDATRAGVAEAQARLERDGGASALLLAQRRLATLCGAPVDAQGAIATLPALPPLDRLLDNAPAVLVAQRERTQRGAQMRLARAERLPDVALAVGTRSFGDTGHRAHIVSIAVPLPLFERGQGAALQAVRRAEQATLAIQEAEQAVRLAAEQEAARLASARAAAATLQEAVLPAALEAYEAAAKGLEYGKFGVTDVLDAQRTLLRARADHLDALAAGYRAAAELERLLGHHGEHAQ